MNQHHNEVTSVQQWLAGLTQQPLTAVVDKERKANFFNRLQSALFHKTTEGEIREKITKWITEVQLSDNAIDAFLAELWFTLREKKERHNAHIADRLLHKAESSPLKTIFLHSLKKDDVITVNYTFNHEKTDNSNQSSPREKEQVFITRMLEYISQQTGRFIFNHVVAPDNEQPIHLIINQRADAEPYPMPGNDVHADNNRGIRQAAFDIGRWFGLSPLYYEGGSATDSMMAQQFVPPTGEEADRFHPADIVRHADIFSINSIVKKIQIENTFSKIPVVDNIDDLPLFRDSLVRISGDFFGESLDDSFDELHQSLKEDGVDFLKYENNNGCYDNSVCQLVNALAHPLPDSLPVLWESMLAWLNANNGGFYPVGGNVLMDIDKDAEDFLSSIKTTAPHDISPDNNFTDQSDVNAAGPVEHTDAEVPVTEPVSLFAEWISSTADSMPQKFTSVIAKIAPIIPILYAGSHVLAQGL